MEDGNKEALARIAKVKANKAEILSLSGLGLTTIPPQVFELTWLREFSLSRNRLTVLPPEIGQLTKLKSLWLNENNLTDLAGLANLTQAEIYYKNNPLEFDFYVGNYPVTVLSPERVLIGCTVFEVCFLLEANTYELIVLADENDVDDNYQIDKFKIGRWQTQLIDEISKLTPVNDIPFEGEPHPPKINQSVEQAYGL